MSDKKTEVLTVRVSPDMAADLHRMAEFYGCSVSAVIREQVERAARFPLLKVSGSAYALRPAS